jgi:hypothetical protein
LFNLLSNPCHFMGYAHKALQHQIKITKIQSFITSMEHYLQK